LILNFFKKFIFFKDYIYMNNIPVSQLPKQLEIKDKIKLNFKSHKKKIVKSTKFLDEVLDKQFVYKYFK